MTQTKSEKSRWRTTAVAHLGSKWEAVEFEGSGGRSLSLVTPTERYEGRTSKRFSFITGVKALEKAMNNPRKRFKGSTVKVLVAQERTVWGSSSPHSQSDTAQSSRKWMWLHRIVLSLFISLTHTLC